MFLYLPLPFTEVISLNYIPGHFYPLSILHPAAHGLRAACCKISILDNLLRWSFPSASSSSHPTLIASSTALTPLFAMNSAKSVFPSFFCLEANARNYTRLRIFFATTICDTAKRLRRCFLRLCDNSFLDPRHLAKCTVSLPVWVWGGVSLVTFGCPSVRILHPL